MKSAREYLRDNDFLGCFDRWKNATWRWKEHWFDTCLEIFKHSAEWAKDFVVDTVNKVISKVVLKDIEWRCEEIAFPKGTELFYLIKAVDKYNNLIFSKVGTTTREVNTRMIEHLRYYKNLGVKRIIVDKVYNCDAIPAECFESYFRARYIMKFPKTYKKNDRFFGVTFDMNEADKIFEECKSFA